jgi:hypothetical protein
MIAAAERAEKDGAEALVIECMPTTVSVAATLIQNGLSHSRVSFPKCEMKQHVGYDFLNER